MLEILFDFYVDVFFSLWVYGNKYDSVRFFVIYEC